ncbi:helix-turn-helix transcriptional regulator [Fusobacterium sp.]|uniref:helix-turn-helix transcriptional regulator n=1 Tax=Fusobacterium sp. TaxID=68766 RepID=UPI00260F33CD|nr:helix-turn-helix transcriptional regulator [Fusobacterium sp.]
MNKLRDIQIIRKSKLDLANDLIKTHIILYGEYKNNDDFIKNLLKDAQELKEKEIMIKELIENIQDPIIQAITKERFINGKTWERVAERVGYSLAHIHKLFKKVLQNPEILKIKILLDN